MKTRNFLKTGLLFLFAFVLFAISCTKENNPMEYVLEKSFAIERYMDEDSIDIYQVEVISFGENHLIGTTLTPITEINEQYFTERDRINYNGIECAIIPAGSEDYEYVSNTTIQVNNKTWTIKSLKNDQISITLNGYKPIIYTRFKPLEDYLF